MTTSNTPAAEDDATVDVIGSRVLVGIQMINISRLSTHPVPLATGGLITVAGQGPTDSNGAGKSSFIAGVSLLHADAQWRLQSGAQAAAELLFTAELAGQEALHANADRGYIVGVFAPPTAGTIADLDATAMTVWLRVNRTSPHLEFRWADRLHVPYGESENERAAGTEDLSNVLPRRGGRTDLRANRLAKTLYGDTVRCVSFLSTSVRAGPTANLLAQPLNELTPERIFDATQVVPGARGTWPRACAWLIRLALETELATFWATACPAVTACQSRRAQLLLLPRYSNRDLGRRATHAWTALSRAGHHHTYELALTAAELRHLRDEVAAVITGLQSAAR